MTPLAHGYAAKTLEHRELMEMCYVIRYFCDHLVAFLLGNNRYLFELIWQIVNDYYI
jgi:hypothetical protein